MSCTSATFSGRTVIFAARPKKGRPYDWSASITDVSLPTSINSTGFADRCRSQTVWRAPSNSPSCSTSQGTSSMTAMLGASSGTASDSARNAWFQSPACKPETNSAPGSGDCASAAVKSDRSAAGLRPRVAWKTT
jgi:hypothetical protein